MTTSSPTTAPLAPGSRGASARRTRHYVTTTASWVAGIVLIIFILGPLVWLGLRAFSTSWTYPSLTPNGWTLEWWATVFADGDLSESITLSLITAPTVTLVAAVICLPAAYALARIKFRGRQFVLVTIFATNAFPKFGLFVTMASLFYALNLMSTFLGVIIVQLIGTIVFMTWIPAAAFASIPPSLEEAARDAGANSVQVFFRITLRMALQAILVAFILSFLAAFDEAQGTFLVGAPDYITMPIQMYTLVAHYPSQVSAVFSILLSIPSVVLMLAVRRHILGGAFAQGFQIR